MHLRTETTDSAGHALGKSIVFGVLLVWFALTAIANAQLGEKALKVQGIAPALNNQAPLLEVSLDRRGNTYEIGETRMLLDREVTAGTFRRSLAEVAAETQPGDEVIIFWSGHGDQVPDNSGDETDHLDEALVLSNGQRSNVAGSTILDDNLGRWVQDFSGCEVIVILDSCHSGGQARNEKGISWEDEFNRFTKDISEQQATVICSSSRTFKSFTRRDQSLSVMPHFLLEILNQASNRSLTVQEVFEYLEQKVPEYSGRQFGLDQVPVLVGNARSKIVFETVERN